MRWTPEDRPQLIDTHTTNFTCHTRRVKAGCSLNTAGLQLIAKCMRPEPAPCSCTSIQGIRGLLNFPSLQAVEVAPGDPHIFWSAGEDAEVRQYDTRCRCVNVL